MKQLFIFSLLAALAVPAQAEEGAPEKLKLLVLDLKTTAVDQETAQLVAELTAVSLSQYDALEVFSGADVKRMMELEAEKFATGCEDDSSCIADIAGALGARYVIYGRLGKLGSRFICTLNLFDADEGKAVKREDIKAQNLDQLSDQLEATLGSLVASLVGGEKIAHSTTSKDPPKKKVEETPKRDVPLASDPENDAAMKLFLIGGGAAVAVAAYAVSALGGLVAGSLSSDNAANLAFVPVFGAGIYGVVLDTQFSDELGGFTAVCGACSVIQLIGIGVAIAGFFVGPKELTAPKRVELPDRAPIVASAMAY